MPAAGVNLSNPVVAKAATKLGDRYVYGATGPSTFDCSGLVQWTYKQLGVNLPRTADEQSRFGSAVTKAQLLPGDLVFSAGSDGSASHPGHVGIYAGGGQVIEAPHTGDVVKYLPLSEFDAVSYRRVANVGTTATDAGFISGLKGIAGGIVSGGEGLVDSIPGVGGALSNLLSFPTEIVGFFKDAADDLGKTASFFGAFFQVSTYVRIGAGLLGTLFLLAGLTFLVMTGVKG